MRRSAVLPYFGPGMDAPERLDQIRHQCGKSGIEGCPAGNQDIVEVASRVVTHNVADGSFEASFDTIALHRIPDFLADGKTEPGSAGRCALVILTPGLKDEARRRKAGTFAYSQELRAAFEGRNPSAGRPRRLHLCCGHAPIRYRPQADRRLRPFARRRARILRPPAVCIRLRKPWRRLRTILLG